MKVTIDTSDSNTMLHDHYHIAVEHNGKRVSKHLRLFARWRVEAVVRRLCNMLLMAERYELAALEEEGG